MAYFKSQFKRQTSTITPGKYIYWFDTLYNQTDENRNEVPPFAIDGLTIDPHTTVLKEDLLKAPEDIHNPSLLKDIYTKWIADCSGAFVKSPTIEQCLSKTESIIDPNTNLASIYPEEEDELWTLQWIPIRIKVDTPIFKLYWSPCYKIPSKSRIPMDKLQMQMQEKVQVQESMELQNPEKTYTIVPQNPRHFITEDKGWIQEMGDLHLPFADSTTLRLDSELNIDNQKEKLRRKVRDARIRAKLARYRAERMAFKFEEKYGNYPEEDAEEAQTEIDSNDELS